MATTNRTITLCNNCESAPALDGSGAGYCAECLMEATGQTQTVREAQEVQVETQYHGSAVAEWISKATALTLLTELAKQAEGIAKVETVKVPFCNNRTMIRCTGNREQHRVRWISVYGLTMDEVMGVI